ncbi:MAG: Unknown protein [uncultured Thiotrichaceae bacterium]|uniref:DUF3301 domain-containing protein n=1 Tax=uncultured Thiotrichaceae bacterium TaxID=298394 RepID=A0A6S6TX66_9GAMM|nr:MAG: Unknown protein [uncultured Thiotrichaceae bacterium]
MGSLIVLLFIALLVLFWHDSMKSREVAIAAAQRACQEINVQLLDQTVSVESIKPARSRRGRFVFKRIYGFDFSVQGAERLHGRAYLLGQVLQQVQLETDEGMIIDDNES